MTVQAKRADFRCIGHQLVSPSIILQSADFHHTAHR